MLYRPSGAHPSDSGSFPTAPAVGYDISSLRDFRQQTTRRGSDHEPPFTLLLSVYFSTSIRLPLEISTN
jgi:hypothetical protein